MMLGVWWKFRDEFMIYLLRRLVFPVLIKYPYDFPHGPGWLTGHDGKRQGYFTGFKIVGDVKDV